MTGPERRGIVLQPRDRQLLDELAAMRVVDREQATVIAGFGSLTRANVRLLALTRAGLLRRFFLGSEAVGRKALYALSTKGAKLVGKPLRGPRRKTGQMIVADHFIEHQLAVNDVHCDLAFKPLSLGFAFKQWLPFFEPLPNTRCIPDGYVELTTASGTLAAFIEADLGHESIAIWRQKVRNYLDYALSGRHERDFDQRTFRVLVLANSEGRLRSIRQATASITEKLFRFAELDAIRREGFFAPVWYRAQKSDPQPLT